MEDDLVLGDTWTIAKTGVVPSAGGRTVRPTALRPASSTEDQSHGRADRLAAYTTGRKCYIDGDTADATPIRSPAAGGCHASLCPAGTCNYSPKSGQFP